MKDLEELEEAGFSINLGFRFMIDPKRPFSEPEKAGEHFVSQRTLVMRRR